VLASVGERPVLARQGHVLVSSFHPELTADGRLHRYFLEEVA
jgi:pyridoxal 5'-phosphate synthase pdxT subunit